MAPQLRNNSSAGASRVAPGFRPVCCARPRPWIALVLGASLLLACRVQPWRGFPATTDPSLTWPPQPEKPRVAYVMEIRQQDDLFKTGGVRARLKEIVAGPPDSTLTRPFALAMHPEGGLLIADPGKRLVHFYWWERRQYVPIGLKLPGGLQSPVGVAATPDGRILVSDSRSGTVEIFDAKGESLGTFGDPELLERPAGIVLDPLQNEVYIADVSRHRVAVFDTEGRLLRSLGQRGNGPGEFNFPTHLALDSQGYLIVSDSLNFRIQVLEPDGTFVRAIGQLGDAPGQFAKPKGVAVDTQGNIIVAEGLYGALEIFSPEGDLLLSLGTSGSDPGQFWLPAGLFFDRERRLLFVADSFNSRVQVFRLLE